MVGRRRVFGDKRRAATGDRQARTTEAKHAFDARLARFDGENAALHGHCRAAAFLLIDPSVWNGRFGPFLHALDLVPHDEWNVLMLAGDEKTARLCGLPLHPGAIPGLNVRMTEMLARLDARFAATPEATADDIRALRDELIDYVAFCKAGVVDILTADNG